MTSLVHDYFSLTEQELENVSKENNNHVSKENSNHVSKENSKHVSKDNSNPLSKENNNHDFGAMFELQRKQLEEQFLQEMRLQQEHLKRVEEKCDLILGKVPVLVPKENQSEELSKLRRELEVEREKRKESEKSTLEGKNKLLEETGQLALKVVLLKRRIEESEKRQQLINEAKDMITDLSKDVQKKFLKLQESQESLGNQVGSMEQDIAYFNYVLVLAPPVEAILEDQPEAPLGTPLVSLVTWAVNDQDQSEVEQEDPVKAMRKYAAAKCKPRFRPNKGIRANNASKPNWKPTNDIGTNEVSTPKSKQPINDSGANKTYELIMTQTNDIGNNNASQPKLRPAYDIVIGNASKPIPKPISDDGTNHASKLKSTRTNGIGTDSASKPKFKSNNDYEISIASMLKPKPTNDSGIENASKPKSKPTPDSGVKEASKPNDDIAANNDSKNKSKVANDMGTDNASKPKLKPTRSIGTNSASPARFKPTNGSGTNPKPKSKPILDIEPNKNPKSKPTRDIGSNDASQLRSKPTSDSDDSDSNDSDINDSGTNKASKPKFATSDIESNTTSNTKSKPTRKIGPASKTRLKPTNDSDTNDSDTNDSDSNYNDTNNASKPKSKRTDGIDTNKASNPKSKPINASQPNKISNPKPKPARYIGTTKVSKPKAKPTSDSEASNASKLKPKPTSDNDSNAASNPKSKPINKNETSKVSKSTPKPTNANDTGTMTRASKRISERTNDSGTNKDKDHPKTITKAIHGKAETTGQFLPFLCHCGLEFDSEHDLFKHAFMEDPKSEKSPVKRMSPEPESDSELSDYDDLFIPITPVKTSKTTNDDDEKPTLPAPKTSKPMPRSKKLKLQSQNKPKQNGEIDSNKGVPNSSNSQQPKVVLKKKIMQNIQNPKKEANSTKKKAEMHGLVAKKEDEDGIFPFPIFICKCGKKYSNKYSLEQHALEASSGGRKFQKSKPQQKTSTSGNNINPPKVNKPMPHSKKLLLQSQKASRTGKITHSSSKGRPQPKKSTSSDSLSNNLHGFKGEKEEEDGVPVFICKCGKRYGSKGSLHQHVRDSSGGASSFRCSLCPKSYSRLFLLKGHMKSKHNTEWKGKTYCHRCDVMFETRKQLVKHRAEFHIYD